MEGLSRPAACDARELARLQGEQVEELGRCVRLLGGMLAAMERRMQALESERAQQVTISHKQALALRACVNARAAALREKHGLGPWAEKRLRTLIRRAVYSENAIRDLHDLPLAALAGAQAMIGTWTSLREIVRLREEEKEHG